jgi:transcriptional regulator
MEGKLPFAGQFFKSAHGIDYVLLILHNSGGSGEMMEVAKDLYRRELLKGSTETLLLSLLATKPMYGYQLVKEMDERSSGYFRFKEGTLYPALHRLERDDWIEGNWETSQNGQNRRYYYITAKGRARLESMIEEWNLFTRAVNLVAQPDAI